MGGKDLRNACASGGHLNDHEVVADDDVASEVLGCGGAPGLVWNADAGREVGEDEGLDIRLLSDAADVFNWGMIGAHVMHDDFVFSRAVVLAFPLVYDGHVDGLVDEHVGSAGKAGHGFHRDGVAGEGDGAVGEVEAVAEGRVHGRMLDECRGDADVFVLHDGSGAGDLVHVVDFEGRVLEIL